MYKRSLSSFVTLFLLVLGAWCLFDQPLGAANGRQQRSSGKQQVASFVPKVIHSVKNDKTIPLRDMKPAPPRKGEEAYEIRNNVMPKALASSGNVLHEADRALKNAPVSSKMPSTFENFEGINNLCGCLPPDTNGDVGPNNYLQIVNSQLQVFDKAGNSQLGPVDINTLWDGFGGDCETHNQGDPVALYDHLADRWLVSQFAFNIGSGPFSECVAISSSGDPTGSWNRYQFFVPSGKFPDYPKLGVWSDAYYMTTNQFDANLTSF